MADAQLFYYGRKLHYPAYIANYYERFDTVIRSCVEDGYEAAFVSDIFEF